MRNAALSKGARPTMRSAGASIAASSDRRRRKRSSTMKRFLAIYVGTASALAKSQWQTLDAKKREAVQAAGLKAWMDWGVASADAIVDQGSPLGKTKRASADGI